MQEGEKKRALAWVGVIAVLVALVLWVNWISGRPAHSGITPIYAPAGQLVPQFPRELILDNAAAVGNSYSINYSSSTNQYTAEWASSGSVASWVSQYENYFQSNGWSVTANKSNVPSFRSVFAAKGSNQVLVSIVSEATGVQITVTYVSK